MAQSIDAGVARALIRQWLLDELEQAEKNFKASNNRATDSTKSVDNRTADPHNNKEIA